MLCGTRYLLHLVPRPRFPLRRGNFGDSATNKGQNAYFSLGGNRGKGEAILTPNKIVLTFGGLHVCVQFGENRRRNATVRVSTDGQTHIRTDAKRFYYPSHAMCYSYG